MQLNAVLKRRETGDRRRWLQRFKEKSAKFVWKRVAGLKAEQLLEIHYKNPHSCVCDDNGEGVVNEILQHFGLLLHIYIVRTWGNQ